MKHCECCGTDVGLMLMNPTTFKGSVTVVLCPPCLTEVEGQALADDDVAEKITKYFARNDLMKMKAKHLKEIPSLSELEELVKMEREMVLARRESILAILKKEKEKTSDSSS